MIDENPQSEQMSDESMTRTLAAQATATWPQERPIIDSHDLPDAIRILDLACGTGEFTARLAAHFPKAVLLGIDIDERHLARARQRCADAGDRVRFEAGSAFQLELPDDCFDLSVCRHLLQAVPEPERVVGELIRVTRGGGVVHLVAEDYGMMHFHSHRADLDRFWLDGPVTFARRTGTDLRSGRRMYTIMRKAGLTDVRVNYVVIDTLRVDREIFADIWVAWRDGYARAIARETTLVLDDVLAAFNDMINAIRDPDGYAVWQLPVISGRKPQSGV